MDKVVFIIVVIAITSYIYVKMQSDRKSDTNDRLNHDDKKNENGIIFGIDSKGKVVYSPTNYEEHVGVFSATGTGKTSAIGIPTLRAWNGTSFVIDISGDIYKNSNMSNSVVYEPENTSTFHYNIFGSIDFLANNEEKDEALEQLAYLLMPDIENTNDSAKFFNDNGRKILTAALIAFYHLGMDFSDIMLKIVSTDYRTLFREIDATRYNPAILYINSFLGASEQNTSGCKQACSDAIKLFAVNAKIRNSLHRPEKNKPTITASMLETNNIFIVLSEDKLTLYAPVISIITSQIMQYISTRKVTADSLCILLFLDEFGSLRIDADLILNATRRFRKRKCRILMAMQNTVDLDILYGKDISRAILSNLHYKVLLGGLNDPESQKYFADLIGYHLKKQKSVSKNRHDTTKTESESREYVIEPSELDKQGHDTVLLITSNEPNGYLILRKNYYFK